MRKNSFVKKAGAAAGLAAVFGLVASGVFVSVNSLADAKAVKSADVVNEAPAALTTAEDGSDEETAVTTTADTADTESGEELTVAEIAEQSLPAMVSITITQVYHGQGYGYFGGSGTQTVTGSGSGVIYDITDDTVYIITNQHVVDSADTLSVEFVDETTADAAVVGEDEDTDLAVISVPLSKLTDSTKSAIATISIGDSDALKIGEEVVAIGNAKGYGQSVSAGIVSAKNRVLTNSDGTTEGTENGLIQTDAAINPGNSGGALINMQGELVGINSAKFVDSDIEGMGYAIPITDAMPIIEALRNTGSAPSGSGAEASGDSVKLGISCIGIDSTYAEYYGLPEGIYVKDVEEGSDAAEAGVASGDIITAIDGVSVSSTEELSSLLAKYSYGDTVTLTVERLASSYYGNAMNDTDGNAQGGFGGMNGGMNGGSGYGSTAETYETVELELTFTAQGMPAGEAA